MWLSRRQSLIIVLLVACGFFVLFFAFLPATKSSGPLPTARIPKSPDSSDPANPEPGSPIEPITGTPAAETTPSGDSPFTLQDFHRSEVRNGKRVWEITAKSGTLVPDGSAVELQDAVLWMTLKNGKESRISADSGKVYFGGADLSRAHAEGSVELFYDDRVTIRCEEADYDLEKRTIFVPDRVDIRSERLAIVGTKLTADLDKEEFVIHEDVSTVIQPRSKKDED